MATLTLVQAINQALKEEMRRDSRVVVLGEDVGRLGGVFRATDGLLDEFGSDRVIDTPLAEGGIIGASIGMAMQGLIPVPEIQFVDFIYPAFDQIVNELAKMRYRSGGQFTVPVVIRTPYGGGIRGGHYHSQSPEAYFVHTAGLKVVIPATPSDARALLVAAIRDPDPVIFLEPKKFYRSLREEIPERPEIEPLGRARIVREGRDVTVLAYGSMLHVCREAAEAAARGDGVGSPIEAELIDLRTLWPLDIDLRTGRVVIVHEAPRACGYGAELAAQIAERAIDALRAPIVRVTGLDTPFPYTLEQAYMPDVPRVLRGLQTVVGY
jgi:pyruvate dehydrogenase E1 component beta subunit